MQKHLWGPGSPIPTAESAPFPCHWTPPATASPQGRWEHSSSGGVGGEQGAKSFAKSLNVKSLNAKGEFLATSLEIQTPNLWSQKALPVLLRPAGAQGSADVESRGTKGISAHLVTLRISLQPAAAVQRCVRKPFSARSPAGNGCRKD